VRGVWEHALQRFAVRRVSFDIPWEGANVPRPAAAPYSNTSCLSVRKLAYYSYCEKKCYATLIIDLPRLLTGYRCSYLVVIFYSDIWPLGYFTVVQFSKSH